MEKTASYAQALSCQMFSKPSEQQQIIERYVQNPFFKEICEQLITIQQMFVSVQQNVPYIDVAEAKKLNVKERLQELNKKSFGNVVHIQFTQQKAPMYIVLRPQAAQQLKEAQLQILPLIELCAFEQRDVIILASSDEPIVLAKGEMTYDAFMRFMSMDDIGDVYSFERFVKHSIATPFVHRSDIVIVDMAEQSLTLSDEDVALFNELKQVFQCSLKAVVKNDLEETRLEMLFDEVYVANKI